MTEPTYNTKELEEFSNLLGTLRKTIGYAFDQPSVDNPITLADVKKIHKILHQTYNEAEAYFENAIASLTAKDNATGENLSFKVSIMAIRQTFTDNRRALYHRVMEAVALGLCENPQTCINLVRY